MLLSGAKIWPKHYHVSCYHSRRSIRAVMHVPSDPSLPKCLIGRPPMQNTSLQLVLGRSSLCANLGIQELDEASLSPLSVKVNNGVVASLDQLDGGEALHLDLLQFVGSAGKKGASKETMAKMMGQDIQKMCKHW